MTFESKNFCIYAKILGEPIAAIDMISGTVRFFKKLESGYHSKVITLLKLKLREIKIQTVGGQNENYNN